MSHQLNITPRMSHRIIQIKEKYSIIKKITKRKIKRETKHFPYVIMIHQGVRYEEDNYFSESLIE